MAGKNVFIYHHRTLTTWRHL